jgi:hypothetical protein
VIRQGYFRMVAMAFTGPIFSQPRSGEYSIRPLIGVLHNYIGLSTSNPENRILHHPR